LKKEELLKENQKEDQFQKKVSGRDAKKSVAKREALINTDLAKRFQFTTMRREMTQEHPTVVIHFEAKPGQENNSIPDQVIRRMEGTLWVDEATADVARIDVRLTKSFSVGLFGMLGTIKDCRLELYSKPMTNGVWLPEKSNFSMSARILLKSLRFRMEETSTNFVLEPAHQPDQLELERQ
jgi:hypothetical protein